MPNLKQLLEFHDTYGSGNNRLNEANLKSLNESFNWAYFDGGTGDEFRDYFAENPKERVVLLYIDITNFSEKIFGLSNDKIKEVLDNYYDVVIPIIYHYGGEVEKTIGDAIICVFGKPFLDMTPMNLIRKAERCSKKIIETLKGKIIESKIALHYGEIMYYKCSSIIDYEEFTLIGSALTELHRLESVSENNSINFYQHGMFDRYLNKNNSILNSNWELSDSIKISLKGVSFQNMKYFKRK